MTALFLFKRAGLHAVLLLLIGWTRAWTQEVRPPATAGRIAAELKEIENAANSKAPGDQLGRCWALLGSDYHDMGDLQRAEDAYGRALKLLGGSPSAPRSYAITLDAMASVYLDTGRSKESETCRRKAIAVFEGLGDRTNVSILHGHLAESLLKQRKNKEAETELSEGLRGIEGKDGYAREAATMLLSRAYAKCLLHRCSEGLADAKAGMEIARTTLPSDSIVTVVAWMVLGYTLWQTGDPTGGGESMREGLRALSAKKDETPSTLALARAGALAEYAEYLNATHHKAEARQLENEIMSLRSAQGTSCNGCTVNVLGLSNAFR